jgi:hypothetical protein
MFGLFDNLAARLTTFGCVHPFLLMCISCFVGFFEFTIMELQSSLAQEPGLQWTGYFGFVLCFRLALAMVLGNSGQKRAYLPGRMRKKQSSLHHLKPSWPHFADRGFGFWSRRICDPNNEELLSRNGRSPPQSGSTILENLLLLPMVLRPSFSSDHWGRNPFAPRGT